jgi:tetratricopeptide (TPR) repeat protein
MAMARYRLGLCDVALGDPGPGMEELAQAIALAQEGSDADLVEEMRGEYVSAYARAGEPRRAIAELHKVGGEEHAWDMLKSLAGLYHDSGRTADAARLFQQLLQERPLSPDAPLFRYQLVGYQLRQGDKKVILAEVKELAKAIQAIRREGHFARPEDQKSFAQAQEKADVLISSLATTWHEGAQSSGSPAAVTLAAELCTLYLALFPEANAPDIRKCSEGS